MKKTKLKKSKALKPLAGDLQPGETHNAIIACNDWLRMGYKRSLPGLLKIYKQQLKEGNDPPCRSLISLRAWSSNHSWRTRATLFDADIEEEKNALHREAINTGLALPFERINALKAIAEDLHNQFFEKDKDGKRIRVWVPETKMIGTGDWQEKVIVRRFNPSLISELRGTLDDIAKEQGQRKTQIEQTGKVDHIISVLDGISMDDV